MNYPIQHEQVANLHAHASRAEPTQGSRPGRLLAKIMYVIGHLLAARTRAAPVTQDGTERTSTTSTERVAANRTHSLP